ncbi:MAG: hypothetical protein A2Y15_01615 [Clostridiales bacterium GWF2_36_10]|nr:MAG: hypothetical protein A2Y15_01615 [Clostridiales bacterium GWF2_36_10]
MLNKNKIKSITTAAVLSALSIVMVFFMRTPIFATAPYLEYDPADVPILIGGIVLGPLWGLAIAIVVSGIQAFTVSSGSGIYGFLMHVLASGTLVLVVSLTQKYLKATETVRLIISVILGAICATVVMVGANLIITPYFLGAPVSVVKELILPIIIPFNLIKLGGNAIVTALLYKTLKRFINQYKDSYL